MNAIVSLNRKPPQPSSSMTLSLDRLTNALEPVSRGLFSISDRLAPTGEDTAALRARMAEISDALRSSPSDAVKTRVVKLFARYPSAAKLDAEMTITAYVTDLQPFPIWAIDGACMAFLQGQFAGSAFPPSCGELVAEARRAVLPYRIEGEKIRRVLTAEVYHEPTDAERAKVRAQMDALIADLRLNDSLSAGSKHSAPLEAPKKPEEALSSLAARLSALPAPTLSSGALNSISRREA